jgi:uncharacterized protein (DUF2267 family)
MSNTGLEVFDRTVQTTNIWLNEVSERIGPDKQLAWHVLGTVLRVLRDRLPPSLAAHLGAELPLLVRGAYYDQYQPERAADRDRHLDAFLNRVGEGLVNVRPVDPQQAVTAVFNVLNHHLDLGQSSKVRQALPAELRSLWPESTGATEATRH